MKRQLLLTFQASGTTPNTQIQRLNTKKIFDYSWSLASYAYEVSIDKNNKDSITFRGYHEYWKTSLKKVSENTYHAGEGDQYWVLTFTDFGINPKLQIHEYRDSSFKQKADPTVYELIRKNLKIDNEELYFAKNIIAGEYYDSISNATIVFENDLDLTGIDSLNKYSIQIDPWDMVPQMDILRLYNRDNNTYQSYNWRFEGNYFILSSIFDLYNDGERTSRDISPEFGDYAGSEIDSIAFRLIKKK
jgi:hypothetical protein